MLLGRKGNKISERDQENSRVFTMTYYCCCCLNKNIGESGIFLQTTSPKGTTVCNRREKMEKDSPDREKNMKVS